MARAHWRTLPSYLCEHACRTSPPARSSTVNIQLRTPWSPILIASILVLAIQSCKKDDPADMPPATHANTLLGLQVNLLHNGAAFDPAIHVIVDSLGKAMRVDRLRFFLSQPFFLNEQGDTVASFAEKYFLIDLASNGAITTIGEVDAYLHTMHFGVGLDSSTNHTDPLTFNTAPLNDATMSWGWNPAVGYQFLQFEGLYDSNSDGTVGNGDGGFVYHCGSDALLRARVVDIHTDADMGGNVILVLECDLDQLMQGISVAANPIVEIPNGVAKRLMSNLATSLTHP